MSSLIIEIQKDALSKSVSTSNLLRKALVAARKLRITDIETWLLNELNGYGQTPHEEIPEYREFKGTPKVHNPYNGWIPLHFESIEEADVLSRRKTGQSITELEDLISNGNGSCYMSYPEKIKHRIMKDMHYPMEPALFFSKSQIVGLIDKVRNTVLEWTLTLEENGVLGDDVNFSTEEKQNASHTTFNIKNLIGTMNESQIQQDTISSTQSQMVAIDAKTLRGVISEILGRIPELQLDQEKEQELRSEISCIQIQLASPKPKREIISECLKTSRSIIEGATGSALFQGVLVAIGTFL